MCKRETIWKRVKKKEEWRHQQQICLLNGLILRKIIVNKMNYNQHYNYFALLSGFGIERRPIMLNRNSIHSGTILWTFWRETLIFISVEKKISSFSNKIRQHLKSNTSHFTEQ